MSGENGQVPLHHAAAMGDEQLLSALLSCGSAEQQSLSADKDGRLPMHHALRRACHAGGAARVPSIKRCVAALVDAAGASQLGVRDESGLLALDYVLAALADAEATARAELEEAEQTNSAWLKDIESSHKAALQALDEAHSAALADAKRQATAEAALQLQQDTEGKLEEAERKVYAAEERTKEAQEALGTASRQYEQELAAQRAAVLEAQTEAKDAAAAARRALEQAAVPGAAAAVAAKKGGEELPRESVESLPLSPPRPPSLNASGSWDGTLLQQIPPMDMDVGFHPWPLSSTGPQRYDPVVGAVDAAVRSESSSSSLSAGGATHPHHRPPPQHQHQHQHSALGGSGYHHGYHKYPESRGYGYGYGYGGPSYAAPAASAAAAGGGGGGLAWSSKAESEGHAVVELAGRVSALAAELSSMLAVNANTTAAVVVPGG